MANRSSCLIYDSWGILIRNLPDEIAGILIKMVLEYAFEGGTSPSPDDSINAMFFMIKDKMDEDKEAYEEEIRRRSEAGKKGMSKRWDKSITKDNTLITEDNTLITEDNKAYQDVTNITDSVSVSDSVSDSNKKHIRSTFQPPDVSEVRSYCQERKNTIDPEAFVDHYTANGWLVGGKSKMKDWRAAVRNWEKMENARSGTTKRSTQPSNTRTDYDFDAIERALVRNG